MLGVKIILTEIMGFATLGEYITNRVENTGGPTISVCIILQIQRLLLDSILHTGPECSLYHFSICQPMSGRN